MRSRSLPSAGAALAGGALFAFLAAPVIALAAATGASGFLEGLRDPIFAPALRLSLFTTSCSLAIVVTLGTPLAWIFARRRRGGVVSRRLWHAAEVLVQLPVVIPPAVAGVALLFAFGRRGLVGAPLLAAFGISIPFTPAAVVLAEVFVSAPFFLQAALSAFRRLDENLLVVARTLGASPARLFFRVALPLALPALVSGAALSWARALGEFGATLMFAGNLSGRTQTLPLAIYAALETDVRAAQAISLLLLAVAGALLLVVRIVPALLGPPAPEEAQP